MMPIRILTVTGTVTAARIAATHSATRAGIAIRQAPKAPACTRSLGQPQLRLISTIARLFADSCGGGEPFGRAAAELQRQRLFLGRVQQQSRRVAAQQCLGGDHLRVQAVPAAKSRAGNSGSAGRSNPSWERQTMRRSTFPVGQPLETPILEGFSNLAVRSGLLRILESLSFGG